MSKYYALPFLLFFAMLSTAEALESCTLSNSSCSGNECRLINDVWVCFNTSPNKPVGHYIVPGDCWDKSETYLCYDTSASDTCSSSPIQGCILATSNCSNSNVDGQCIQLNQNYVCTKDKVTTYSPVQPGSNCAQTSEKTCHEKIGSYCVNEDSKWSCAIDQGDCITEPECTKVAEVCLDTENGQCSYVEQTYDCTYLQEQCNAYQTTNSCTNISLETPSITQVQDGSFNKAMQASSMAEMLKHGAAGDPLRVFAGKMQKCKEVDGCSALGTCCCGKDAERNANFLGLIKCSEEESELYGRKKKGLAVSVGSGCTAGVDGFKCDWGGCKTWNCAWCTEKTYWYCTFDNKLARAVQEQGRAQLAALASQGFADAQTQNYSFSFYGSTGSWIDMGTVNGNRLWRYQYSEQCNSISPPAGENCPAILTTYFAVCDNNNCHAPNNPPPLKQSDDRLNIVGVNPIDNTRIALSRNVVVKGDCDSNASCSYAVSAWKGGNFQVPLTFLFRDVIETGVWSDPATIRNLEISSYTYGESEAGDQIKLRVKAGSNVFNHTLPKEIPPSPVQYVPGTQVRIFGGCDAHGYCSYTLLTDVAAYAKPFRTSFQTKGSLGCNTKLTADCSGFTIEEFSLLDLGKMDLSFLANDLKPTPPDQSVVATQATEQIESNSFQPKTDDIVARINQGYCEDACTVKLSTVQKWLPANITVSHVAVDWGDGSTSGGGYIYEFSHHYSSIGDYVIKVHFTLQNGDKHYAELKVRVKDRFAPPAMGPVHVNLEAKALW